ncbi:holin [Kitasatospora sp. NPDC048239]|uniref:holin n=1 Tax=Kitasatospora sp. NPDC048239 TaxID=3364046 RepID=UPI00371AC1C1
MARIETKVKAATAGAYLASTALLADLTALQDQPGLVSWLPAWVAPLVLPLIPAAITAVAGYQARHTPRTDVAAQTAADTKGL